MFKVVLVGLLLTVAASNAQPPPRTSPPPTGGGPGMMTGDLTCAGNGLTRCPMEEPFQAVTVTSNENYRLVQTTGCPPYRQNWTVQQETCIVPQTIEIPINPRFASTPVPIVTALSDFRGITYLVETPVPVLGAIGIFDNGVFIYGSSSPCGFGSACPSDNPDAPSIYVDAVDSEGDTIDFCGGHPTPTELEYHVHSGETFSGNNDGRLLCGLPLDTVGQHSVRLGWMYDGFGIYGRFSQGGNVPTDLDECSGHTHEINGVMTYHYHIPDSFPWIIGCFKGCPRVSNNQRQLEFADTGNYGCPEGLAEDPDPLIEVDPSNHANRVQVFFSMAWILVFVAVGLAY